jgi:hypothetical protein
LREQWRPQVEAGEVLCGYCDSLIPPGTYWDLSHPLDQKDLPAIPWHRSCNRSYARRVTRPRRNQPPHRIGGI